MSPELTSRVPARLILPALRSEALSGFAHEAGRIADALEIGVGGFIIFGGTAETVRKLTADLLRRAGRPLLLAADLERGAGQQIAGLTEFPPPMALASVGDPAVVRWAASVTAQEAMSPAPTNTGSVLATVWKVQIWLVRVLLPSSAVAYHS